ncbi:MAG TPA: class I SAM-dependent methyltransferase, partial [Methanocorpusculum sp.]|nr:class I SAM-dependent methyltransferase [Methanocorpusculum sp.]
FDAVFCWHVLGHLPATVWPTAASEMRRVLRPSGKMFLKGFSRNDMRCGKGREVEPYSYLRGDGIVTHYFTDTELREVFGTGELTRVSWKMRVRGTDYLREELCGVFGREGFV